LEYYVVNKDVWAAAHRGTYDRRGFLCIGCLERRIGRKLTPADFTKAPVNNPFGNPFGVFVQKSDRLLDRLGVLVTWLPAQ
jgi:hypothetical protein